MKTLIIALLCVLMCLDCTKKVLVEDKFGDIKICNSCGKSFKLYDEGMRMQVCDMVSYYCFECSKGMDINAVAYRKLQMTGFGRGAE